jgi:hypothetical protein
MMKNRSKTEHFLGKFEVESGRFFLHFSLFLGHYYIV